MGFEIPIHHQFIYFFNSVISWIETDETTFIVFITLISIAIFLVSVHIIELNRKYFSKQWSILCCFCCLIPKCPRLFKKIFTYKRWPEDILAKKLYLIESGKAKFDEDTSPLMNTVYRGRNEIKKCLETVKDKRKRGEKVDVRKEFTTESKQLIDRTNVI